MPLHQVGISQVPAVRSEVVSFRDREFLSRPVLGKELVPDLLAVVLSMKGFGLGSDLVGAVILAAALEVIRDAH